MYHGLKVSRYSDASIYRPISIQHLGVLGLDSLYMYVGLELIIQYKNVFSITPLTIIFN